MLTTILPDEMKRVEKRVMALTGVTGQELMERAAAHVADAVARLKRKGDALCLCGPGNNGGDGLAAMRILAAADAAFQGTCWLLSGQLSPDAAYQLERLQRVQPRITVHVVKGDSLPPLPQRVGVVVDALFGTGLSRPLTGPGLELCKLANRLGGAGVPVVAVDIPSGLNGATGEILGAAVEATETVTFHRPKPGLFLGYGLDYTGHVTVEDIGLPWQWDDAAGYAVWEEKDLRLPPRKRLSHKGTYGRVLLWVGSRGMAGAATLSAAAALRTGAGLVTVACPESILDVVQTLCPCATCIPLPENDTDRAAALLLEGCQGADAVGAGCGLGRGEGTARILRALLTHAQERETAKPLVLDADGLNLLAAMNGKERYFLPSAVFTPHPAEAARLLGTDIAETLGDPVEAAGRIRAAYGASVVLKGAASVLHTKDGTALNVLGTPAMAKGGSGDALTGVLTALLAGRAAGAYCLTDLQVLQTGCGLHGLAGRRAEKRLGQRGVLATDLCYELGRVAWKDE